MFREMRRTDRQLSTEESVAILERGSSGVLALLGDGGYTYAVPLSYAYHDGRLYFHGASTGHKLDAARAHDRVSFCVIDRDEVIAEKLTTSYRSVIAFGRIRVLESEAELRRAAALLGVKYSGAFPEKIKAEIDESISHLGCMELTVEHLTGKASDAK